MQNTSPLELYNPRPLPLSSCSQTDYDRVPETNNNAAYGRSTHELRHLAQSLSLGILKRYILSNHRKVLSPRSFASCHDLLPRSSGGVVASLILPNSQAQG
jgi:hypothetical protein